MSAIKAIVFDCFGVLTTDTWEAFLVGLPEGTDTEAARRVHRAYDAGQISVGECNQQIKDITGKEFTELVDVPGGDVVKNTVLLEYIGQLRVRGYKIGLLSNIASSWIQDEFLTPQEQGLFDEMILSYQVGVIKPNPKIFALALERLGVEAEQVVLLDDRAFFCEAAQKEGWQAIVYNDFKQAKAQLEALLPDNTKS